MTKKSNILALLLAGGSFFSTVSGEVSFSGDATVVSTYYWRGVKQFEGAALQGTAEFARGPFSVGYWVSSFADGIVAETDPYIGLALPTGSIEISVGATVYSYDFFAQKEYTVYELYASAGKGPLSASFYYTPKQRDDAVESVYWVELCAETSLLGADVSATYGYGSYSAFASPNHDVVSSLLLGAARAVSNEVSVGWNWIIGLDGLDNGFFLSAGYGF